MKKRYIILGLATIIAYNVFLIQRDNRMFEAYEQQTVQHVK